MPSEVLNETTREYYNSLIPSLQDYVDFRWRAGPVQRSHYRHTRAILLRMFEKEIGHVSRLLEVGPGPGTWSEICRSHTDHLTLCDISREMLKNAHTRLGDSVTCIEGDFTADETVLPGSFNAVVSFRALEYMDNKKKFVERAHGLLESDGTLMVITKNPGWRDKRAGEESEEIHKHWISWSDLSGYMSDVGFRDVRAYPVAVGSYNMPFNNRVGVLISDLWNRVIFGRPMRRSWDALVESYLVVGRKR